MAFLESARRLARNPLGIIALFIALIYGFATVLLGVAASHLESDERAPLVWFVVLFPVLVLAAFYRLVTNHHGKLYAPTDYSSDESFLQTLSPLEREARLEEEVEAVDAAAQPVPTESSSGMQETRHMQAIRPSRLESSEIRSQYLRAEELVIKRLERELGHPFERQVSFGPGRLAAFDGVAQIGEEWVALEVKLLRSGMVSPSMIRDVLYRAVIASSLLSQRADKKRLKALLVVVLDDKAAAERERVERIVTRLVADSPVPVDLRFFVFEELSREAGTDA